MAIVFDGPSRVITITTPGTISAAIDLYSAWKYWALTGDNAKYAPAFQTLGGDPLSDTDSIAPYFFIRNDLGWRVKPPEAHGEVNIDGNLVPRDPSLPMFIPSIGNFTVAIRLSVSSKALVVSSGGSGLTATQDERIKFIEKMLRNKMITDPVTGIATLYDDDDSTVLATSQVYESTDTSQPYRGKGAQRREKMQ